MWPIELDLTRRECILFATVGAFPEEGSPLLLHPRLFFYALDSAIVISLFLSTVNRRQTCIPTPADSPHTLLGW